MANFALLMSIYRTDEVKGKGCIFLCRKQGRTSRKISIIDTLFFSIFGKKLSSFIFSNRWSYFVQSLLMCSVLLLQGVVSQQYSPQGILVSWARIWVSCHIVVSKEVVFTKYGWCPLLCRRVELKCKIVELISKIENDRAIGTFVRRFHSGSRKGLSKQWYCMDLCDR